MTKKKAKFVKGSKEAKAFMAKLRAKRGKVSGDKETKEISRYLKDRNQRLTHGYHTQPNINESASKARAKAYKKHTIKQASKFKKEKPFKPHKLSGVAGLNDDLLKSLSTKITEQKKWSSILQTLKADLRTTPKQWKGSLRLDIVRVKNALADTKKQIALIKKNIK